MDDETRLLSRLAANHLYLAQFEPLRAVLVSLRIRDPDLALAVLQTIVAQSGRFENALWSTSCPSSSFLTYLSTLELLQFDNSTSAWSFGPETLHLRAQFLLLAQILRDQVSETLRRFQDLDETEGLESGNGELGDCVRVLDRVLELGVKRLKADGFLNAEGCGGDDDRSRGKASSGSVSIEEAELMCLRWVVLESADVCDALCWNAHKQIQEWEGHNTGMAITVRKDGEAVADSTEEDDLKVLGQIMRSVQIAHLDAIKECVKDDNVEGAMSRIRFLHVDPGSEECSSVLQDLLKNVLSSREAFGDDWHAMREKLLWIYREALSSNSTHLARMIEVVQDKLLSEAIEMCRAIDDNLIPLPVECFQKYMAEAELGTDENKKNLFMKTNTTSCTRDLYHHARVSESHLLECVMDSALSAVKREQLQEASNIISLFPQLQPLVASMGWDLLSGKAAARRKLMQLLWISKSQVLRLEEPSLYGSQSDEKSCVEHLCDSLCYELDVASFVSCVNSGQLWNSKSSLVLSGEQMSDIKAHSDPFVENFVLERLSAQSPLRVLFDMVPDINFQNAIELISMQPITSAMADWKRMQDIELMHMHYALESTILALGSIERSITDGRENHHEVAFCHLKDLGNHLKSVNNIPRKILLVNVIISLLHMDVDDAFLGMTNASAGSCFESSHTCLWDHTDHATKGGNQMVISFTTLLFDILRHNLPTTVVEQENASISVPNMGGKQALQWRIIIAKQFMEDWQWRLSILQRLLPLSERQWRWKEALTILRAAPSKLLNLCLQRAKYDIGGEAVQRFSLSAEDKATLELAEWVDSAFMRQSVEDAVSRAADGTSLKDLDFHSLQSQLGPLSTVLLCVDVAATSARTSEMAQKLLSQAQVMLSEINPGGSPKLGSTYWNQICELGVISVSLRVIKHLIEFLEQDNSPSLQSNLAGEFIISSSKESHQQGQRVRAIAMLQQMIEDAHMGKRQFLSGMLHNLARAIADEETDRNFSRGEDPPIDCKVLLHFDKDGVLGLGLGANIQMTSNSTTADSSLESVGYDIKNSGKRLFGSLSTKATAYLSRFILHIAAIGDIVDGTDTTHDFNFFSLIYEWPKDLLSQLVFDRGSTDAAEKVAEIMYVDFVHEMISACVPPVYPPQSGIGWASIPVIPTCQSSGFENEVFSPSSIGAKSNCYSHTSAVSGVSLHALQLDIVRHLVRLSPVRAILACVFGSSIVYVSSDSCISNSLNNGLLQPPEADRLFYEFALDQSERFPTLNRWIQMQTNLHRVSEFAVTPKKTGDDGKVRPEARAANKRLREHESDAESDADDIAGSSDILAGFSDHQVSHAPERGHDSPKSEGSDVDSTLFLSFNWENEEPYEKAVERLIDEGKLMDALALSDRFLCDGASDGLLRLLIESEEESNSLTGQLQGFGSRSIWSTSWQYCLRLKDKQLAARLALKYMHRWELDAALNVLTMCNCHLSESDPSRNEVLQMKQALQRYSHILSADEYYRSWQEVELECKVDPEGLALRLAGQGAVSAALEVAESAGLSIDLRRDLQGRQLVKLLTADPLSGGGPAEASRFLSSLCDSDDALAVAVGAMQLLPDLRSKQLLVHFFLKRRDGNLSDVEVSRLNSWSLGLRVLGALPLPWQQRCSSLHEHPHLILEVLLMRKQLQSASLILKEFPSLRDNNVIIAYAGKAISVKISSPSREPRKFISGTRTKQKTRTHAPTKSSFSSSLSNLHKEARKAFSWAPRNASEKAAPKDDYRKRKSSRLASSEKVDWEAMTGNQDDRSLSSSADGQERLPSVAVAEEWMLTRDPVKNQAVRSSHRYASAPDIILFKELLSLCSDEFVSAKTALGLCINQMKNVLSSQQLPENASVGKIGQACLATETFLQGLLYAKSLLRKLIGGVDLTTIFGSRDADDAFSDVGSSSVGSQSTDQLSEVLSQADTWLGHAELLQSLLGSGIAASLDDIADKESSARLCHRLIVDEKYSMAVYTCKKCKIDVFPVWNAWGHALIRTEHYAQARVKFKQALQLHKGDPVPVVLEIINTIEGGPSADVPVVRSMYEHLSTRAPTNLDDSLSADSYLHVLHMPSTFPRSEKSRESQESSNNNSSYTSYFEDGPRSNLDDTRYLECVHYLQDHARQHLLDFMFKHGHFNDACCLFFPLDTAPAPSQLSSLGAVTSSSSPQRSDPLSTDYGSIDDLCDLCVDHSAMPVLEEVISTKMASTTPQEVAVNQYMATALSRICTYCETHKHFNYLYKFQVIKKDHIAAGLCCIQLFMNSSSQEDAIRHLEHAKMHFDEALSERYKGGHSTKLITKGVRGKSAPEKISEEGLVKFSARVNMQVDVVKSFSDSDGWQWKHSLFGNPNDHETFRRRCVVAETLVEKNFDLAFQVIYEFNLPAVDIYAGVASALAEKKKGNLLTEFFRNIKGTIDDDDWDQVLGAAINVYSYKHRERPDRLIDMLTSSHRKVLACVGCGRLKTAFQIASRSGSVADVQYVAHQALHANSLPVLDLCKQWLAQCT